MNIDLHENAEKALRMVREAKNLTYDTEGTGVDWRFNHNVGYVVGAPREDDSISGGDVVYVPVRHGSGGNLLGGRPMTSPTEGFVLHPFEAELAKAFEERNRSKPHGRVVGHNMKFDVHMSANSGIMLGRHLACTQNMAAMADEYARRYSLEAVSERYDVTAKKGDEMYAHLAGLFGGPAARASMGNFWRTSGVDPVVNEYATGDGVSTWEVYVKLKRLLEDQDMTVVMNLENDLIWTVFRMERTGIKVDMTRVDELRSATEAKISGLLAEFPVGFNTRSPVHMRKAMEDAGYTDWPLTEKGAPSFAEKWLKKNPLGKKIIEIRQNSNLISSFINPLAEKHVFNGRVHATLNQLKNDDKGTISGRFSCSDPNLQQVPKRVKNIAKPFRRLFVADEGWTFWERDFSQCFVAGTKVSVPTTPETPEGTINIEDIQPGQLVYSFDQRNNKVVLRPVVWAGQTGVKKVARVKWWSGTGKGRSFGEIVSTPDHVFYDYEGSPVTPEQMSGRLNPNRARSGNRLAIRMRALSRTVEGHNGRDYVFIGPSGQKRILEHRLVYNDIHGWSPEQVHHVDNNPFNNSPSNLEGLSDADHRAKHRPNSVDPSEIVSLLKQGLYKTEVAEQLGCTVHAVEYWRQKLVPGHTIPKGAGRIDVNEVYYWLDRGLNYADTALQLGCAAPTVRYHALRRGQPRVKRPVPANKIERGPVLQFLAEGGSVSAAARAFECSKRLVTLIQKEAQNHVVYDVEDVEGEQPVYCLQVEETHCMYVNDLLVANCEPRLFAHYSQAPKLLEGYNSTPFRDMHTVTAEMLGVERDPTAKRMGMGILTGMQSKSLAGHMGCDEKQAQIWMNQFFDAYPEIKGFQDKAKSRLKSRGYVHTLLGRRCRLEDARFAYRGTSKIIQGSNADIVKLKLLEADRLCEDNGDIVRVLMTVHDSYNGQYQNTPEARALFEHMVREMAEVQVDPFNLSVPFILEGTEGGDWCEATFGPEKEAA